MSENSPTSTTQLSRRQYLKSSAGLAALTVLGSSRWARGANERIGIGFIGAGGRSNAHLGMVRLLRDNEQLPLHMAAVSDVYRPRMLARQKQYGVAKAYMDYRDLLADPDVDVVCISTPDHWHGRQAIDAIKAGKDVYCEKPVTHWDQFAVTKELAEVVSQSDRVLQLGTQAMSDSVWHQMKQLVQDGLIGQPLYGETSFFRIGDWGERGMRIDDPNAKPGKDLDWEGFLGDRSKVPYSVDRHFRWRLFSDYAGGPVTDLFPHCVTQIIDIMGVGFPESVVALGGIHRYDYELRDVPDTFNLLAQYPEKVTIAVLGTQANDYNSAEGQRGAGHRMPIIRGWDGSLTIDRKNRNIVFTPVRVKGAKKPQTIAIKHGEDNTAHWRNLLECCRNRKQQSWSPMDLAYKTQTMLHMAMQAHLQSKVARFDTTKQEIMMAG